MPYHRKPGFHHDHEDIRRWLRQVRIALSSPTPPPAGHVAHAQLAEALAWLTVDLPRDMAMEETIVFHQAATPETRSAFAGLTTEHVAVKLLADCLDAEIRRPDEPTVRWAAARVFAVALERALTDHMAAEEALLSLVHADRVEAVSA